MVTHLLGGILHNVNDDDSVATFFSDNHSIFMFWSTMPSLTIMPSCAACDSSGKIVDFACLVYSKPGTNNDFSSLYL